MIQITSQYAEYMEHILNILAGRQDSVVPFLHQDIHPYRPCDIALPRDNTGFCYILISLADKATTYIGKTYDLHRRILEHNSGSGSLQTAPEHLRPWALLAFVCGFDHVCNEVTAFEGFWKKGKICFVIMNTMQWLRQSLHYWSSVSVTVNKVTISINWTFVTFSMAQLVSK